MTLHLPRQWGRLLAAGLMSALLCACSTMQGRENSPFPRIERQDIHRFELNGRMSITQKGDSNTVRIHWTHSTREDLVRFSGPLGNTLAELRSSAGNARWTDSNGEVFEATSTDDLLAKLTDLSIPLDQLSQWVLGRTGSATDSSTQHDVLGRMTRTEDNGWTVRILRYESETPNALPGLLDAAGHDVHIRLVIEDWKL